LIKPIDIELAKKHAIGKDEVKRMRINMLVDSGAFMMAINESIHAQLQLPFKQKKEQPVDGSVMEYDVVGPIEVLFKNRQTTCNAFVLKGDAEPCWVLYPWKKGTC
jgi:acetyl-CoA carboxylase carboxyltransferase component